MRTGILASFLLLLAGCASTSARPAFRDTASAIESRVGYRAVWRTGGPEDAQVDDAIEKLLAKELTIDGAVLLALLNDRNLQAEYEELGVAQADLVQAGLLRNPTLAGAWRFPLDPHHLAGIEADLVQDFLGIFTLGAKKRIAGAALEAAKARVGHAVITHVYEVKKHWYAYVAAEQTLAMRRIVTETAEAAVELAQKQFEGGTLNDLDLANEQALYAQIVLDQRRAEGEVVVARERLNRLMGIWGPQTRWTGPKKLPELPAEEPTLANLETLAVKRRLDLAAARADVKVVSYGLALAKNVRWTGIVDAGVSFERKPEGIKLLGPSVAVEIPIFDRGQAQIAKIEAQLRQAQAKEWALAVAIRSEVREDRNDLLVARSLVETYGKKLVPLREKVVALSQQYYDAMLLGVFQLLQAKQNEIEAWRGLIESARDYWIARAELEEATAGALPPLPAVATSGAPKPKQP